MRDDDEDEGGSRGAALAPSGAGAPRAPRPCRRGEGHRQQRALLEAEGVVFDARGRIDLARFGWDP